MKNEKTLKQHGKIVEHFFAVATILLLICLILPNVPIAWAFLILGIAVMGLGLVYRARHFKCPHCEKSFSRSQTVPAYCPHCGGKLGQEAL